MTPDDATGGGASDRDVLVEEHLGFAHALARRYTRRGIALDDLEQVAAMALVKAADRYDPDRGVKFTSFAAPTIIGELKRHFRDKGWAVQVPRRLQELSLEVGKLSAELNQALGRAPTVTELAEMVGTDEEEVLEALELSGVAYKGASLDQPVGGGDDETLTLADQLQAGDIPESAATTRATLRALLETLPGRERRILELRFFEDMTQSEIADDVGLSQMHVSRLIRQSLDQLRLRGDPDDERSD